MTGYHFEVLTILDVPGRLLVFVTSGPAAGEHRGWRAICRSLPAINSSHRRAMIVIVYVNETKYLHQQLTDTLPQKAVNVR